MFYQDSTKEGWN